MGENRGYGGKCTAYWVRSKWLWRPYDHVKGILRNRVLIKKLLKERGRGEMSDKYKGKWARIERSQEEGGGVRAAKDVVKEVQKKLLKLI